MAAVLAAGDDAALSHVGAAWLAGISRRPPGSMIDVVSPRSRRGGSGVRIHVSRTLIAGDVTRRRGIPVTSVARTLLDLGDIWTPHQVAHAMHQAQFHNRLNLRAVRSVAARARGRPALRVLMLALELHTSGSAGTRSELEEQFLALVRAAGLDDPLVNTRVRVGGGHTLEVDFHWPRSALCIEVDGWGHRRLRTRREDAARDALLERAGLRVLRCTPSQFSTTVEWAATILHEPRVHERCPVP